MFKFFKRIFSEPLNYEVYELLEDPSISTVFVLDSLGLPKKMNVQLWIIQTIDKEVIGWKRVQLQNSVKKINLPPGNFERLNQILNSHDFWNLKNDYGTTKDGSHNKFIYSDKNKKKVLSIHNPEDSEQEESIKNQMISLIDEIESFFEDVLNIDLDEIYKKLLKNLSSSY